MIKISGIAHSSQISRMDTTQVLPRRIGPVVVTEHSS
jgi:hypothetical protein